MELFDERKVATDSTVATFWVELTRFAGDRSPMVESSVHHKAAFSTVVAWANEQIERSAPSGGTRARIYLLVDPQHCLTVEPDDSAEDLHALLLLEL